MLKRQFVLLLLIEATLLTVASVAGNELPYSMVVYPTGGTRGVENMSALREMGFDGYYHNGDLPYHRHGSIQSYG